MLASRCCSVEELKICTDQHPSDQTGVFAHVLFEIFNKFQGESGRQTCANRLADGCYIALSISFPTG